MQKSMDKTKNVMTINIGNAGEQQCTTINFHYVEDLQISMNKFYKFVIYSCLTKRYEFSLNDMVCDMYNI